MQIEMICNIYVLTADPPMYAESLTGAVDIRDEDDDQPGSVGDYMFTPMYTYVYDYRYRCPPAYSEVFLIIALRSCFVHCSSLCLQCWLDGRTLL